MDRSSKVDLPSGTPEFILTRDFAAPRALVWTCWMDPSHLSRWWGPKPFTCPVCEVDARVGGKFRMVMRSPEGTDYPMSGIFREIVPQQRIVKEDDVSEHSETWHDMVDPDRKGQWPRKIELLTTVTFEDHGVGTRVVIRTRFPSVTLRDSFAKIGMQEGWAGSLQKLDDLTDALKDSDREISFTRLLCAPVGIVYSAFSNPAGLAIWWGPNGFTTTTYSMAFRVGGNWHFTMHGPDGTDYPNYVSYTAIEPNRRIAYDHGTGPENPSMFKAVISFAEDGPDTRVNLKLTLPDAAQQPHFVGFGAVEGGYQTLGRLAAFLGVQVTSPQY